MSKERVEQNRPKASEAELSPEDLERVKGAGPGAPGGHVRVFDGATGAELRPKEQAIQDLEAVKDGIRDY